MSARGRSVTAFLRFRCAHQRVIPPAIYGVDRRCHSLSSAANRLALSDIVVAFGMGSEGAAARFTGGLPQRESADSLAEVLSGVEVPFVAVEVLFVSCAFANDAADAIEMIANAAPSF